MYKYIIPMNLQKSHQEIQVPKKGGLPEPYKLRLFRRWELSLYISLKYIQLTCRSGFLHFRYEMFGEKSDMSLLMVQKSGDHPLIWRISHFSLGFSTIPGGWEWGFQPSTVCCCQLGLLPPPKPPLQANLCRIPT